MVGRLGARARRTKSAVRAHLALNHVLLSSICIDNPSAFSSSAYLLARDHTVGATCTDMQHRVLMLLTTPLHDQRQLLLICTVGVALIIELHAEVGQLIVHVRVLVLGRWRDQSDVVRSELAFGRWPRSF